MPSRKESAPPPDMSTANPEVARLQKSLKAESQRCRDLQQKLLLAEKQLEAQRKEISVLHHDLGMEGKVRVVPTAVGEGNLATQQDEPRDVVGSLRSENDALKKIVRKQMLLIDTLKRQKILCEATTVLALTEREFAKDLELDRA